MGRKIIEMVDVIRSKNAGPYEITFDLIFKDFKSYQEVRDAGIITRELIADLYRITPDQIVSIINFDPARAIKITIIRSLSAGAVGERDVYGAQQHAPLLGIEI